MSATNYQPTNVIFQKSEGFNTTFIVGLHVIHIKYCGSVSFLKAGLNLTQLASLFLAYFTGLCQLHMLRAAKFGYVHGLST